MSTHKVDNCFLFFFCLSLLKKVSLRPGMHQRKMCLWMSFVWWQELFLIKSSKQPGVRRQQKPSGKRAPSITEDNHRAQKLDSFYVLSFHVHRAREWDVTCVKSQGVWSKTHQVNINMPFDFKWAFDKPSKILALMSQSFSNITWIIFQVGVVEGDFKSRSELCVLVVIHQRRCFLWSGRDCFSCTLHSGAKSFAGVPAHIHQPTFLLLQQSRTLMMCFCVTTWFMASVPFQKRHLPPLWATCSSVSPPSLFLISSTNPSLFSLKRYPSFCCNRSC